MAILVQDTINLSLIRKQIDISEFYYSYNKKLCLLALLANVENKGVKLCHA